MELDDLKTLWRERDAALDARLRLDARATRAVTAARASLRPLHLGLWSEIVAGGVLLLAVGDFAAAQVSQPAALVASVGVGAWLVGTLIAAVHTLALLRGVDWSAAVVTLQRRLATIRVARGRAAQLLLAGGVVLWAPAAMIVLSATGLAKFSAFGGTWLLANILVGCVALAVAIFSIRRAGGRLDGDSLPERVARTLAGISIERGLDLLASIDGEAARS